MVSKPFPQYTQLLKVWFLPTCPTFNTCHQPRTCVALSFPSLQCPSRYHPADGCLLVTVHDTWNLFSKAFCSLSIPSRARPSLPPVCLEILAHVSAINLGTHVPPISRPWKAHCRPYFPVSHHPQCRASGKHSMLVGRMTLTFKELLWVHEPKLHYFSDRDQSKKGRNIGFIL